MGPRARRGGGGGVEEDGAAMASRKPAQKTRSRKPAKKPAARPSLPELRLPHLDEQQLDLVGLGLVALAAFFAPVFYLGWNGGEVGEALASAFVFFLGGVANLVPIALFGIGALIV